MKRYKGWQIIGAAMLAWGGCFSAVSAQSAQNTNTYVVRHRGLTMGTGRSMTASADTPLVGYPQPLPAPSAAFPIVVSFAKKVFAPNEPILVSITLTNVTPDKMLTSCPLDPIFDYKYQISRIDATGKSTLVGWTAYGKSLLGPGAVYDRAIYRFDTAWLVMRPGEVRMLEPVLLSRLFDMSLSGTYTIRITQRNQIDGKPITLSAKPVTVEVD